MMPHCCPVCAGRGMVPGDFYLHGMVDANLRPERCRSCAGRGYVWQSDSAWYDATYPEYIVPGASAGRPGAVEVPTGGPRA